jgi:GlcNAc-P-P-Und epimerase
MQDKQTIVIFGGSGFVGSHFIEMFAATHDIVSVDIKPPTLRVPSVTYITADVRDLDNFSLPRKPDRIYNFAAIHTTPGHPFWEYYDTNVKGALQITRFAEKLGVGEIIFTSSISTYGPSESNKTENSATAPQSAYGYSKFLAEEIHRGWYARDPSRRLLIVRPAVVFGAREGGNFTRMAGLLKRGFFIFPGRKDTIKACIYVKDLIETIEFARAQPENYNLFNGAYPERYTIEQIVNTFIADQFPKARTYLVPRAVVTAAARFLSATKGLGIGIHPERVEKLVRSTDVVSQWLTDRNYVFSYNLRKGLDDWGRDTGGAFN